MDPVWSSYTKFVESYSTAIPSLSNLSAYLSRPAEGHESIVHILKEATDPTKLQAERVQTGKLKEAIEELDDRCTIFFIEDPSRDDIELLGKHFAIHPLFFANHIHGFEDDYIKSARSLLPSVGTFSKYDNFNHQLIVSLDGLSQLEQAENYIIGGNIQRRVVLYPLRGTTIGVLQQCCSLWHEDREGGGSIGQSVKSLSGL